MGWWSHCWMRMGSGNSQALGCCSGKRGSQDILDYRAQGKNSAPKLDSFVLDPSSLSFLLPWPPHGLIWGQVSLLFASCLPQKSWNSVLPFIISPSKYQSGSSQTFPNTQFSGLSSSVLEQVKRKRLGGSTTGWRNDEQGASGIPSLGYRDSPVTCWPFVICWTAIN